MQAVLGSLTIQPGHVLGILDGLDEDALRRPVLPSGWSCAGLVQHLAVDVERFWFRSVMVAEQAAWDSFGEGSAWALEADTTSSAVLALYRQEIGYSDRIIHSTPADAAPASWPEELFGDFRLHDLHAVMLHVITETACHAGHLDAARELIDGRTWRVLYTQPPRSMWPHSYRAEGRPALTGQPVRPSRSCLSRSRSAEQWR